MLNDYQETVNPVLKKTYGESWGGTLMQDKDRVVLVKRKGFIAGKLWSWSDEEGSRWRERKRGNKGAWL